MSPETGFTQHYKWNWKDVMREQTVKGSLLYKGPKSVNLSVEEKYMQEDL
jgi:hypothetical protein